MIATVAALLYLASSSPSRQQLLKDARIPFKVVRQTFDEQTIDWNMPIDELVTTLAQRKMEQAILPEGNEEDTIFVLTADSLTQDKQGIIYGKPTDKTDAMNTLRTFRDGVRVITAFYIERKKYQQGSWQTEQRHMQSVVTECVIDMPERWLKIYYDVQPFALDCAGAMSVEGYGAQFLKSVNGSYTNILGLPMAEVRQALEQLGFFK